MNQIKEQFKRHLHILELKESKISKAKAELKSIEQMKLFFLSLCDDNSQVEMVNTNNEIFPFDINDIINYVKNIINEYNILKGF